MRNALQTLQLVSTKAAKLLFDTCGVKYKKLSDTNKKSIEVPLEEDKELIYIEKI